MEGFELLLSAAEILENSGETTLTVPDDSFPNETAEASFVRVTTSTPCRPKDGEKSQQDIQPRLSGERSPRNGSGRNYHPGSSSGGRDPRREYHYYKDASWHRSNNRSPRDERYLGDNTRRTPSRGSPSHRSRGGLPRDESNRGDNRRRVPPRGTSPHPDSYSQRRSRDVLPRGESYSRRTPPRGSSHYLDRYSQRRSHDRTHQDESYRGGNTRRTPSRGSPSRRSRDRSPREESYRGGNTRRTPSRGSPSRRSRDRLPRDESYRGDDSRRAPPRGTSPHLDRYSQRRSHDRTHQDESQRGHNTRRTPSRGSPSRRSRDRSPRDESYRGDDSRRVPPRGSPSGRSDVRSPQGESSLDRGVLNKERHVEIFQRVASPEIPSPAFSPLSNPKQIELDPDYDPEDDLDDDAHPTDLDDFSIFEIFEEYRNISLFLPEPEAAAGEEKLDDAEAGEEKTDGFENDLGFEEVCDVEFKKAQADKPLTNKVKRERGLSYATYRGKIMPARSVKDPCHCAKLQCYTKYDDSMRQTLLQNLLKLPRSGQDQFIANHLEVLPVQNHRVINSRRNYSYKYFLPGIGGRVRVCLEMFLSTLDLGEKKVRILAGRLITGSGVCGVDGRLLNRNRNALEPEERKYIEDHIRSFPAYTSHLGREKSSKLYLSSELNIAKMHQLYVKKCLQNGKQAICYNTYRLVFRTFKLGFIKPKLDRCNDCEKFRTALKVAENDTHRSNIRDAREEHQAAAKAVYNAKKADVTRAKSHKTICTASFDLQKCLPTPHLRCGMAYYKRQLYTLNLTVFYTINGKNGAKCFLWNETLARRGSQEIASCVYQFIGQILDEYPSVTEFIFYSDRCGGQNLNFTLCMMFSFVAEKYSREKLNVTLRHNFMVSGHSHMEVDSVHAAIEKAKKSTSIDIEIPRDWAVFIAQIKRKVPLEVIELDQTKFIEFKQLEDRYKKPKIDSAGNPIKLKTIYSFEYRSSEIGKVFYKLNVDNDSLRVFDIGKVDQLISSDLVLPAPIETEPIKLSQEKLNDLKSLLPFIQNKAYYETMLKTLSAPKRGRKIKVVDDNCFDNDMDWDDDENLDE